MLALVYLVLVFLLGDTICKRFFPFVSAPHRVATSFLAGLLISTWLTYAAAAVFGGTEYPMLAGNIIFAIVAIALIIVLNRDPGSGPSTTIDPDTTRFVRADWIAVAVFFVVAVVMMYGTFTMNEGNMRIANHQSSDFGSTASIMQSFALGHNFPTEYPHFTGERIRYHFLFYFQAGNLEYLGLSPAASNNTLSILTLLSMLVLVMTLGSVLFRSRTAGRIGAILFYFHGSLSFIPFYLGLGSLAAVWNKLGDMRDFLPSGFPYRGEEWGVWSQVVYLNQRHLASSIGLFLIVVVFLAIRHRERVDAEAAAAESARAEKAARENEEQEAGAEDDAVEHDANTAASDRSPTDAKATLRAETSEDDAAEPDPISEAEADDARVDGSPSEQAADDAPPPTPPRAPMLALAPFILAGVLLGLMPMWNGAVFAGAAGVLSLMFLLLPYKREMIALAVASALVSLPQVIFLKTGLEQPAGYSLFYFGYTISEPTVLKVLQYLAFTFGFKWIFIAIALILGTKLQRLMIVSFTTLVVMATCFQFSEEVLANHKFFNVWLVLMNVPVGFGILKLWNLIPTPGAIALRVVTAVLVFGIVIGGILDLFPIKNSFWVEYKFKGDPLVEWVRANTDPRSIFLSHRYVNHGILVAGRRLFYGHPYYAWGAGYATGQRDNVYRRMLESKDINEVFSLIKANKISYVAIDNIVRNGGDFIKANNERLFQAYFPVVFSDTENKYDSLKIYKVPDELGQPDTSVTLDPMPSPTPVAATVQTAFSGGEGAGSGQFSRPRGIAADKKGNFYVADTGNSRIQKFTADGTFVASFGKPGTAEGELKEPNGVAVDEAGNIFLTDAFNHKLVKLDEKGVILKEWKGPEPGFYGPRDLEFGPDKKLYIVDQGRTRIVVFDPSTESFTSWGSSGTGDGQFNEATGLAIGGGKVFVADTGNNRIQVFDPNGTFVRQWEVPAWEKYIWHYPDVIFDESADRLYVTNGWKKEVLVFDVNGSPVDGAPTPSEGEMNNPSAACIMQVQKERTLLVVNTGGNRISRLDLGRKR